MATKPVKSAAKVKQPPQVEEEPVLSGRLVVALAIALVMVIIPVTGLGDKITKTSPTSADRSQWSVGQSATIHLTVVTSDYGQLGCASEKSWNGNHCEYKNERERYPRADGDAIDDNRLHILQPYRTTDQNLILAAGLWAQPEVAMRLHNEPSLGVASAKLARFVAACEVTFIEEWAEPFIRWNTSERWSKQGAAMVTEIKSCHILEEER